ncbi:hypothetical protein CLPUN_37980 [Clostridium puniceum]|uniref:Uncharacterized protein n=1 Tax=Clostridium puniceum TaxID=29367 RepID=A0A1S8T9V0_9CLOT|nr:hypothetical protein [Clostridium puniceum]OOM74557.1 hypothetical protein CLPUN_37980 [Clostridium puniceum]
MNDNWYALCISILTNNSSEDALGLMNLRPDKLPKKNLNLTKEQALNLKYLRQTMSWNELGKEFGINGEALRMQVYNALKKTTRTPTKVVQVA